MRLSPAVSKVLFFLGYVGLCYVLSIIVQLVGRWCDDRKDAGKSFWFPQLLSWITVFLSFCFFGTFIILEIDSLLDRRALNALQQELYDLEFQNQMRCRRCRELNSLTYNYIDPDSSPYSDGIK